MPYRPALDDAPAPAGSVTWSMDADPVRTPLQDEPNEVLERDVWTSADGKRRIRHGNTWKLSGAHVIGLRYERRADLVVPGSSPFDVAAELSDDWVRSYRAAYQRCTTMQLELAEIWRSQGGERLVLQPLAIKGGVTFLGDEPPANPLLGDRWIKGQDRNAPALVWALDGDREQWIEQGAQPA